MLGDNPRTDDNVQRLLKPSEVVKWYREITGLHRDVPLPRNLTYKEMLTVVMAHDAEADDQRVKRPA